VSNVDLRKRCARTATTTHVCTTGRPGRRCWNVHSYRIGSAPAEWWAGARGASESEIERRKRPTPPRPPPGVRDACAPAPRQRERAPAKSWVIRRPRDPVQPMQRTAVHHQNRRLHISCENGGHGAHQACADKTSRSMQTDQQGRAAPHPAPPWRNAGQRLRGSCRPNTRPARDELPSPAEKRSPK
jgi:hypothetical protein